MTENFVTRTHYGDILALRERAEQLEGSLQQVLVLGLAADLLELHDATGISLDNWGTARRLVENLIGHPIVENHV